MNFLAPVEKLCIRTTLIKLWKASFIIISEIFAIFDDFSKWSVLKVLRNFEKSSNMAKNEEKALFDIP